MASTTEGTSSDSDRLVDKATPHYRWITGTVYLDPEELSRSRSFRQQLKQAAKLAKLHRERKKARAG